MSGRALELSQYAFLGMLAEGGTMAVAWDRDVDPAWVGDVVPRLYDRQGWCPEICISLGPIANVTHQLRWRPTEERWELIFVRKPRDR